MFNFAYIICPTIAYSIILLIKDVVPTNNNKKQM